VYTVAMNFLHGCFQTK